jgi:DNA polymerase-1
MQNIPSTSRYAKIIKDCFVAPPGWLFMGADFASLEDRISALTTEDPNKLKVYTGHIIYELEINGVFHQIRDDATINFDGKQYSGEEFYEKYRTL